MCKFNEFDFNYETMDLSVIVDDCLNVLSETAYDYTEEITFDGMESLVNEWFDARHDLISEWGVSRLSIEVEGMDYQKVKELVNNFNYKLVRGCEWVYKREEYTTNYLNGWNELLSDELYTLVYWLRDERNINNILNNQLNDLTNSMDENTILNKTKMRKGVKVSKLILNYLNTLVNDLNKANKLTPELLKEYRKEIDIISQNYSKLIELFKQCNSKHTVYLSCDIRDIFRCSYGNDGWKSCHRLGGEYGAGAISYILNPNVLIAYVSTDDETLDWREMVYIDLESRVFVGSRQYKNANPSFMKAVQNIILERYGNGLELFDYTNTERIQQYIQQFIKYSYYDDAFAYNDIHLYDGIDGHVWILKPTNVDDVQIDIQTNYIICLQCGERMSFIESDVCECNKCRGYGETYYCEMCECEHDEAHIHYIEYYDENGYEREGYICSDCMCDNMFFCNHCHQYHHIDNDYVEVEGVGIVCDECTRYNLDRGDYVQCDDCQRVFDAYYMSLFDVDGLKLCRDCMVDNNVDVCSKCGKEHLEEELNNGLCKECHDKWFESVIDKYIMY